MEKKEEKKRQCLQILQRFLSTQLFFSSSYGDSAYGSKKDFYGDSSSSSKGDDFGTWGNPNKGGSWDVDRFESKQSKSETMTSKQDDRYGHYW